MIHFPSARRVCVVLCLLAYPLLGFAAGANLTRVFSDPDADPPSLELEFSGEPDWTQTLGLNGSEQQLRMEFADTANAATEDGYRRTFPNAPGFVRSLSIDDRAHGDTSDLVVTLTFPLTSAATVAPGATPDVLIVTMAPAAVGAMLPALPSPQTSEATQSSVKTLYVVGGLILLLGTGAVVGYFMLQNSGRNRFRPVAVAVPAEEAKGLMREDVDAFRAAADSELDASHERHQRLTRIVRQDMSEIRLEMKSLAGEFERATQSVLLFGEPFVAQADDAPTELGTPASPQVVAGSMSLGSDTEASSESVAASGADGESPYARARKLVQEGGDLKEVGRITGLSSAELDLLARLGRMQSSGANAGDMVKSCVWRSGGVLGCDDFVVVPDSVLEDDSSDDIG